MDKNNKLLFLRYAVPCATTLVQRKSLSSESYNSLLSDVAAGKLPENEPEKLFKIAYAVCKAISLEKGKEIDQEIIREYFWFKHDAVIDERYLEMRDFDPEHCRTFPGKVESLLGERAIVKTKRGKEEALTSFLPKIKPGSFVVIHRGFIVEEINKETAFLFAEKTGKEFV